MHRFFADPSSIAESTITLTGDDVNHISRVLRLSKGHELCVCDKQGTDYMCTIVEIDKTSVTLSINFETPSKTEPPVHITLYQGVAKGEKMDYIIQKCVELGVCTFVPVVTKRTVVKINDDAKKNQRWQKIALEASKQSMRGIVPRVEATIGFADAIEAMASKSDSLNIMAYENEKEGKLKQLLANNKCKNINIIIGPEGGFEEDEANLARQAGINVVTLGPRILRTETAPVAVSSAVMYELGDW